MQNFTELKKSELINIVLSIVENETEVNISEILGRSRNTEAVDARHLAVATLHKQGMYVSAIAETMGITPRYVQYIITNFEDRICGNVTLGNKYEIIAKKVRNRLETTTL